MPDVSPPPWTPAAIEALLTAFEDASLPRPQWTHQAHLLVALATLRRMDFAQAHEHLRGRIRRYNEASGTPNNDGSGYHETITQFFLRAVAEHQARHTDLPLAEALGLLLASPLADPAWPLIAYSPQLLWSVEARRSWVEPDGQPRAVMAAELPVVYSFRRCPYAIRARLALAVSGLKPGRDLELREVNLKAKPPELVAASPKGTVPVLVLPADGVPGRPCPGPASVSASAAGACVIDESLAVMRWALERHDPCDLLRRQDAPGVAGQRALIEELIASNDGPFKHHLDRFKYAGRNPGTGAEGHRSAALAILRQWNEQLPQLGDQPSLADLALLPFLRQFRLVDPEGFDGAPGLATLQAWLGRFLASPELVAVMAPPWAPRAAWRSPGHLFHLALAEEWHSSRRQGSYRRSTRGLSLEEVGFIHASHADQIEATHQRFYADAKEVLLLTIDPARLAAEGIAVVEEPAGEGGELFPHIRGALPLEAVLAWEPFPR